MVVNFTPARGAAMENSPSTQNWRFCIFEIKYSNLNSNLHWRVFVAPRTYDCCYDMLSVVLTEDSINRLGFKSCSLILSQDSTCDVVDWRGALNEQLFSLSMYDVGYLVGRWAIVLYRTSLSWLSGIRWQKTAPFYFCNNSTKTFYCDTFYIPINVEQSKIKIICLSWSMCVLWNAACVRVFVTNVTLL